MDDFSKLLVQTIKLKSGEDLVGIVQNTDEKSMYLHAPALISKKDVLSDYMANSSALGFVVNYSDIYFSEKPSEIINVLYSDYFFNIKMLDENYSIIDTVNEPSDIGT